ncbi:MAG: hypothetical protein LBV74_20790 [Tannerella sp.]|jgi:hypothetical protein|nr:hypothetical protein [Tannerella sp.]
MKEKLSKKELKELCGGVSSGSNIGNGALEAIKNKNTVRYCWCFYNDNSVIKNINKVDVCTCSCQAWEK